MILWIFTGGPLLPSLLPTPRPQYLHSPISRRISCSVTTDQSLTNDPTSPWILLERKIETGIERHTETGRGDRRTGADTKSRTHERIPEKSSPPTRKLNAQVLGRSLVCRDASVDPGPSMNRPQEVGGKVGEDGLS